MNNQFVNASVSNGIIRPFGHVGTTGVVSNPPTSFFDDTQKKQQERVMNDKNYANWLSIMKTQREKNAADATAINYANMNLPFGAPDGSAEMRDVNGIRYRFIKKNGQWVIGSQQKLNPLA